MVILVFLVQIIILFFLSREITKSFSRLFYRLFHSQSVSIHSLSFLFLPGVVLHEFSHLLVASVLFVPTGEVEFLPEIQGNNVKMGSVAIAKTDPLRRFLIGVAPVIGGLGVLFLVFWYFSPLSATWQVVLLLYIVFQIANTMFSSEKDMEGALGILGACVIIGIVLQVLGISVVPSLLSFANNPIIDMFFMKLSIFLAIAMGIDVGFLAVALGMLKLLRYH